MSNIIEKCGDDMLQIVIGEYIILFEVKEGITNRRIVYYEHNKSSYCR